MNVHEPTVHALINMTFEVRYQLESFPISTFVAWTQPISYATCLTKGVKK